MKRAKILCSMFRGVSKRNPRGTFSPVIQEAVLRLREVEGGCVVEATNRFGDLLAIAARSDAQEASQLAVLILTEKGWTASRTEAGTQAQADVGKREAQRFGGRGGK